MAQKKENIPNEIEAFGFLLTYMTSAILYMQVIKKEEYYKFVKTYYEAKTKRKLSDSVYKTALRICEEVGGLFILNDYYFEARTNTTQRKTQDEISNIINNK